MNFTGIVRNLGTGGVEVFDSIDEYNKYITEIIECGDTFTASTSTFYEPAEEAEERCCSVDLTQSEVDFIKDFAKSYQEFTKRFSEPMGEELVKLSQALAGI